MQILQAMGEHLLILLLEDVVADLYDEVGPDTKDVPVERGMVNLA